MRTKKGYVLRTIGKEYILVAEGLEASGNSVMISLNETAAMLWKAVDGKKFDADTLVSLLMDEYGITKEMAEKDVAPLLETWKKSGAITD